MKIKTGELIGAPLDWAVARCEGVLLAAHLQNGALEYHYSDEIRGCETFSPSTLWNQGGEIIEREGISLISEEFWSATGDAFGRMDCMRHGLTPLIAAMRCYVGLTLGGEVEVPDELCTSTTQE